MNTVPFFSHATQANRRSSALLITLLMLSLITIIAVAFMGTMTWESSSARRSYDNQRARALATLGLNTAIAQLRQALDTWDNPYANFATNPPGFFWSCSPGIISRWSYSSRTPITNYPLFSQGSTNLVDLNTLQSDGSYPIASGSPAPNISVYWANVLKNPNQPASLNNQIIGRYAFWVDDENAKININTADGTMKYLTNSLGLGTSSEVSLQALQQGGADLPLNVATNIVYLARTVGLNSPKEILRAAGTTPDLYTNNVFNLTSYSRSPDLNIFGQPKMAMIPFLGDASSDATNMAINGITLQPPVEIYPTPSQLPTYSIIDPIDLRYFSWTLSQLNTTIQTAESYPLVFRDQFALGNTADMDQFSPGNSQQDYRLYAWINGNMLANYLAGKNAAYQPITWPTFPGSTASGFLGKYSLRQIDSIVVQILNLGAEEISPDYFYTSDINDIYTRLPAAMYSRGRSVITSPLIMHGWLSDQWVSGMGREPKVDAMELEFQTYGSIGSTNDLANYHPPNTTLDIWQEWWLPAAYLGGKNVIPMQPYGGQIYLGQREYQGTLNSGDLCQYLYAANFPPAPLPKTPAAAAAVGNTTGIDSYWGNQLMTNNQGMDFAGNPNNKPDPDQGLAAQYHNPYALTNGIYYGTGLASLPDNYMNLTTPFSMSFLQVGSGSSPPPQDWAPGEMRCIRSLYGSLAPMPMQVTADNSTLTIGGGIAVHAQMQGDVSSDPDPTPLEGIRGIGSTDSGTQWFSLFDWEDWNATSDSPINSTTPTGQTVRDRNAQSVIPVNFTMDIPPNNDGTVPSYKEFVLAKVADPLVNKFPGDWQVTYNTNSTPTVPGYWNYTTVNWNSTYSSDNEYSTSFHDSLADPDSYWLPQADCAVSYLGDLASQTLIPRSARFPNIGYLQYLRTGIIPDDESQPYQSQHGTPFRLLSFAPSTESASQKTSIGGSYPDWAMLDLMYVPSILSPFGGPYGYYDTNTPPVWKGYGSPNILANYSTGGGSTPGRINPNGEVIYTTNTTIPQPGVSRTIPMQAMLFGLMVNQHLVQTTDPFNNPTPGFTGGTNVSYLDSDPNSIPQAIYSYLNTTGPLRMPAELCNIQAVSDLRPNVNPTRNDLIRQIVGNLTTQSNTFSVWVAGESVSKSKANNTPATQGIYEPGDLTSASVRYHFIVERYLDPGADGVYGNAGSAGPDGIVGTYDDPVDSVNHPFQPRYLYRVVSTEEIR